jgi:glycosyltransferase involved in cell wall biosynthesis
MRIAFVIWEGRTGGNQTLTADVVAAIRRDGIDARIVFVTAAHPLSQRLDAAGVPYQSMGLATGRQVVLHPRALSRLVQEFGPDCALLVSSGYLAATLRLGGYRAPIVAVEHGTLLQIARARPLRRALRNFLDRYAGLWACGTEVAVSEYMLQVLKRRRHAPRLLCIPNGVDLQRFRPLPRGTAPDVFVVGCGSRLIPGKGVEDAISALAALESHPHARLRIAGDGPDLDRLSAHAQALGVSDRVELLGRVEDMAAFWHTCDVAIVPSREWIESFSIAAVEAMACGLPVVASASGGLVEVVQDGETGTLVAAGDVRGFAAALDRYARDPDIRSVHGSAARMRCEARYGLESCAAAYVELCRDVSGPRLGLNPIHSRPASPS